MTTRVEVVNGADSNPMQHLKVTFTPAGGTTNEILLGPSESWNQWISVGAAILVQEVGAPKPVVDAPSATQQEVVAETAAPEVMQAEAGVAVAEPVQVAQPDPTPAVAPTPDPKQAAIDALQAQIDALKAS